MHHYFVCVAHIFMVPAATEVLLPPFGYICHCTVQFYTEQCYIKKIRESIYFNKEYENGNATD